MKKGRGIVVPALKRLGSDSETRSATKAADTAGVGAAPAWVVWTGVNRVSGLPEKSALQGAWFFVDTHARTPTRDHTAAAPKTRKPTAAEREATLSLASTPST